MMQDTHNVKVHSINRTNIRHTPAQNLPYNNYQIHKFDRIYYKKTHLHFTLTTGSEVRHFLNYAVKVSDTSQSY